MDELVRTMQRPDSDSAKGAAAAHAEIQKIAELDYGEALRGCLSRSEVRELIREGKKTVWPNLNGRPDEIRPPEEFAHAWSKFGVDIRFSKLTEENRLWGFYTRAVPGPRRWPAILVNSAHHTAVIAVAIDHEVGHHLRAQMYGSGGGLAQFSHFGLEEL